MAKVTITLDDIDLDTGTYQTSITVEGSKIDDGQATAAHFAGNFMFNLIHTDEFRDRVWKFAEALVAANPERSISNLFALANDNSETPEAAPAENAAASI